MNAARAGDGAGAPNSCSASPGWVVWSISASPCALDHSARNGSPGSERTRSAGSSSGSPRRLERERVRALLLHLAREPAQGRVGGHEEVAHLAARPRRAADEAADDLAEEELRARARGVDADAQARDVDALGDHQDGHEPAARAGGEAGDPPARRPARRWSRPPAPPPRPPRAGGRARPRAPCRPPPRARRRRDGRRRGGARAAARRRAGRGATQSPSGSSAVRRRRAASAGGRPTVKSADRRRPSLTHAMSPS